MTTTGRAGQPHVMLMLGPDSVAEAQQVEWHLNQAQKHEENPVLIPGPAHAWDGLQVCWPTRIVYAPEERKFRALYHAFPTLQYDVHQYPERAPFARWLGRLPLVGYAESADGVHWEKPDLGFHEHLGLPTNRISIQIRPGVEACSGKGWQDFASPGAFWLNPAPADESERFLALFTEIGGDEAGERTFKHFQKVVYASPDGKAWKRRFVAYDGSSPDDFPAPGTVDMYSVVHDPDAADPGRRVMAYGQTDRPLRPGLGNRGLGLVAGPTLDGLKYDELQVLLELNDEYPEEIHWGDVRRLQNGYTVCIHDYSHIPHQTLEPPIADIRLAISPDGVNFQRVHGHEPLIPRGRRAEFDANQLVASALIEVGDELYLYYHGTACYYRPWPSPPANLPYELRANTVYPICLGLATLPRDRFAYAITRPPGAPGMLTTHPVEMPADEALWLNVEGEAVSVAAVEADGSEMAQGCLGAERSQTVYRRVCWEGAPPVGTVSLRVTLADGARLYSLCC